MTSSPAVRELPDGIRLRSMRPDDAAELDAFTSRVFGLEHGAPDLMAGIWARDLVRGDHPTTRPEDGMVAVDGATERIVACCFLISQTWTYDGIPLPMGRPELIGCEPAYRGRGIVPALLSAIHDRSAQLGHRFQALTGIPVYYRQYGYEPALITPGDRHGAVALVPNLPAGQSEPVTVRPTTEADVPFIARMYRKAAARSLFSAVRDEAIWRYELLARNPGSDYWHELRIVTTADGAAIGCFAYLPELAEGQAIVTVAELADDADWARVAPAILRFVRSAGEAMAARSGAPFTQVAFDWTPHHPLLAAVPASFPEAGKAFVWYVRIPDVAALLGELRPVLERRLAESLFAGETGELTVTTYPRGLRLGFARGRISAIEPVPNLSHRVADICLPTTAWRQTVLGSRSFAELELGFPFEARYRSGRARELLEVLFPKRPSVVWPVA